MGNIRAGTAIISGQTTTRIMAIITARSAALSLTKSEFLGKILTKWESEGCLHVSEPDRLISPSVMEAFKKKEVTDAATDAQDLSGQMSRAIRLMEAEEAKASNQPINVEAPAHKRARRAQEIAERARAKATGEKTG